MSTHFRMTEVFTTPERADRWHISIADALTLRHHLHGARWTAETIRLTTDVAQIICHGGAVTIEIPALARFAATLTPDQVVMRDGPASPTGVALVVAAAAVIGVAIAHPHAALPTDRILQVHQTHDTVRISTTSH